MKKHILILTLFPMIVFAIGSTDRTIYSEILSSKKANQDITITPTGTGDVVLKDYTGFLKFSSGSPTAQASISLTSDISGTLPEASGGTGVTDMATILMELSGDQSVAGVKTFTGELKTLSTTAPSVPAPVMTETQRDALTGNAAGDQVYNSTTNALNVYDGTSWTAVGGGGASAETVTSTGATDPVSFSAFVSDGAGTTTVSLEVGNFINGNCTNPSAGNYVCTFTTAFGQTPNCIATNKGGAGYYAVTETISTTAVTIQIRTDASGATDADFILFCHGIK